MIYPLFLCAVSFVHIPLKLAEQAVDLAVSALTAEVVRRHSGNNHLALVLFGLLAFNPVLWNIDLARVIREGLYISLSLAVVAITVILAFPAQEQGKHRRWRSVLQGTGFGLIAVAFWLTREEGIWLLPTLAVVLAVALVEILRPDWVKQSDPGVFPRRSARFKAIALPFVTALIVFLAADGLVAGLNYAHYGIFETNEFKARNFLRAYGAITRIRHDAWRRYIPAPKDARQHAYSVSPAARELAPFLEGALGEAWRQESCKHVDITPCSDVAGGWFMWDFRDAVALAGHYSSATNAMRFYGTLADEIDAACSAGKIDCLPPRTTMLPPFRAEYIGDALSSAKDVAKVLLTLGGGVTGSSPSIGSARQVDDSRDIVSGIYPPATLIVQGWAAALSGTPSLRLYQRNDQSARTSITLLPSQDVSAAFPNLNPVRFRVETDCPADSCDLVVTEKDGRSNMLPMEKAVPGAHFQAQGLMLNVETATVVDPLTADGAGLRFGTKTAAVVAWTYTVAFPLLEALGAVGLLLAAALPMRRRIPASLLALGLGSLTAVVVRIALLAYIDATSFPAASVLYVSPASPFVIIFAVVGVYSGYSILTREGQRLFPVGQPDRDR